MQFYLFAHSMNSTDSSVNWHSNCNRVEWCINSAYIHTYLRILNFQEHTSVCMCVCLSNALHVAFQLQSSCHWHRLSDCSDFLLWLRDCLAVYTHMYVHADKYTYVYVTYLQLNADKKGFIIRNMNFQLIDCILH